MKVELNKDISGIKEIRFWDAKCEISFNSIETFLRIDRWM